MSQLRVRRRTRRIRALGLKWALATVAPWALSIGMLVSFTASAGQNHDTDNLPYTNLQRALPAADSLLAEGPSMLVAASAFRLPGLSLSSSILQAHLSFDDPERRVAIDPRQPREDMKRSAGAFPEVDRSAKGDPLPGLRPSMTLNPQPRELERVVFGDNQPGLISGGFALDAMRDSEGLEAPPLGFEPYPHDEGLTDPALSDASPRQGELLQSGDGATPAVAAPAAQDSTPMNERTANAIASTTTPPAMPAARAVARSGPARDSSIARKNDPGPQEIYTALIKPENMAREQRCLAEAIYFEARSESDEGRAAVAQVVLNRVKSGLYPDSVCGVVYQNRHRHLACQFTFACEGKSLRITEPEPWQAAVRIARDVYEGKTYLAEVGASTHYHADYVRPYWAKKLKKMDVIGRHVFYKLRPGQT